ncbi:MAG: ABC transporter ATP-binding protein [Deltaproteobacteria bacterium]|nr:ABC transporter ATP-binding protein [Deltaproteobacteria bacterium]MBW1870541.1 ABC transporter ATP-binding protein [Deltaproteobacteria bacterium]
MSLVAARELSKTYAGGDIPVLALRGADFEIEAGSFAAFVGPSGSGKSTLLNLVGCLDRPTSGSLSVADTDVTQLGREQRARFRGEHIGFIFQDFNLLPVLSAFENVELPLMMMRGWSAKRRRVRVEEILESVELGELAYKRPSELSGGQKQRVAVARALVTKPKLVLADEPTANLDRETALGVINLMKRMRDEAGSTFVFSTHDPKVMSVAELVFTLEDGRLREGGGTQ